LLREPAAAERRKVTFFGVIGGKFGNVAVWRQIGAGLGIAAAVAGCASVPGGGLSSASPAEVKAAAVTERANARWQAMIKGDFQTAYDMMTDASRKAVTLERFRGRSRSAVFTDAKVQKVACEADSCKVDVFVTYDHPKLKGVGFPATETWIIERGTFWYVDPVT
jgi:hypothetical protein